MEWISSPDKLALIDLVEERKTCILVLCGQKACGGYTPPNPCFPVKRIVSGC